MRGGWFRSSLPFYLLSHPHFLLLPPISLTLSPDRSELRSMASVPQLLHSNALSAKSSVLLSDRGKANNLLVDFVGLYCKSKQTRRRLGVSSSRAFPHLAYKSLPTPVRAVLDLERSGCSLDEAPSPSGPKPQVLSSLRPW